VIARPAACAHARLVGAGATIFQKGDPGDYLFAACTGTVINHGRGDSPISLRLRRWLAERRSGPQSSSTRSRI
jgi:hypothetical protein